MTDSPPKSMALAIAPKVTALLSIGGSSVIIFKVARDRKIRTQTMHRIMLGLSLCDALVAASFFASTWPIPRGTPTSFGDGTQPIFGAAGNDASCNLAGFFTQFQVASPLFNATLASYYLLVAYYGWTDRRVKRVEWLFYTIPIAFATTTALFAVGAGLTGPVEWTCAIKPPEAFAAGGEPTAIQRRFRSIRWMILFGPVWACIFHVSVIFTMLYRKMRALEAKMEGYKPSINVGNRGGTGVGNGPTSSHVVGKPSINIGKRGGTSNVVGKDGSKDAIEEKDLQGEVPGAARRGSHQGAQNESEGGIANEGVDADCVDEINDCEQGAGGSHNNDQVGRKRCKKTRIHFKGRRPLFSILRSDSANLSAARRSHDIAVQGMLYVVAFYATWIFPTISRFAEFAGKKYFAIQFLDTLLLPLQGFLNCAIYLRPSMRKHWKSHPDDGFSTALRSVIASRD